MAEAPWSRQPLPDPLHDELAPWEWEFSRAGDLSRSRRQLRRMVLDAGVPPGDIEDDVERLLLTYEELASNGFRHGTAPVRATVTAAGGGWLVDVSDAAVDSSPTPAVGRDPAFGGLGLYLVAQLCGAYGWSIEAGRKHVWAYVSTAAAP